MLKRLNYMMIFLILTFLLGCTHQRPTIPMMIPSSSGVISDYMVGDLAIIDITPGKFYETDGDKGPLKEEKDKLEERAEELKEKKDEEGLTPEEKKELDELIEQINAIEEASRILEMIDKVMGELFDGDKVNVPEPIPNDIFSWILNETGRQGIGLVYDYQLVAFDIYGSRRFYNVWYYNYPMQEIQRTGNYCYGSRVPIAVRYKTKDIFCIGVFQSKRW